MTLTRWQVARKTRRCTFCDQPIRPGVRYASFALPPGSDIGNAYWWHAAGHGADASACPEYWLADPYTPLPELMAELDA